MKNGIVFEIGIDRKKRFYAVTPNEDFRFIYRAARGVYWNPDKTALYTHAVGQLTCAQWFDLFCQAARDEYGVELSISPSAKWNGISIAQRDEIIKVLETR